ncbi:MAG: ribosomal protection-like ABC-F family protein [Anaerolineales bacterium]
MAQECRYWFFHRASASLRLFAFAFIFFQIHNKKSQCRQSAGAKGEYPLCFSASMRLCVRFLAVCIYRKGAKAQCHGADILSVSPGLFAGESSSPFEKVLPMIDYSGESLLRSPSLMIGTIARLDKVSHYYGAQQVVDNVSWEIFHDARIGLIGPNAAGKSTLLRILARELEPDSGAVFIGREIRVGYLPQEVVFDLDRPVIEEVRDSSPTLAKIEREMDRITALMGDPANYGNPKKLARLADRHEKLLAEFSENGGLNFEGRVQSTLRGLGFDEKDFGLPLGALSGGQKKLVGLAKLLLEQPDLLLLDEPDNHLDLKGKRFLEELIADYPGAVLIVSHDRYLLDIVAEEIVELADALLTRYPGNYSEYAFEKRQRLLLQEKQFNLQQREIRRMEFAIQRLMGWGAGQNEKFVKRGRSMQKRLDKLERVEKPAGEQKTIGLSLTAGRRGSNRTLELRGARKSFDGNDVLREIDFTIWNGERVGIVGANGSGKTVLLRCILGEEELSGGEIVLGPSNTLGYYDQEHQTLDPANTLADEVTRHAALNNRALYGLLGRFLFTADDAAKKVGDLSGGEKARVQMARLMLQGANFLLLDEPTNHLDIPSAEQLEDALAEFEGTLLVVSHDRYFLDNVVDRIFELAEGRIESFDGNYTQYLQEKAALVKRREIEKRN